MSAAAVVGREVVVTNAGDEIFRCSVVAAGDAITNVIESDQRDDLDFASGHSAAAIGVEVHVTSFLLHTKASNDYWCVSVDDVNESCVIGVQFDTLVEPFKQLGCRV
eukprot:GHVL01008541.1.p2 GENE.GHVL01008541.1~~GHVL01008541.1.p2  ORF type:complete len:107 (-),score=8.59 GHVL01008541.1:347-667(-)